MGEVPRCAIYARVSTVEQAGRSIPEQIRACREYAETRGYAVLEPPFVDEGISAFKDQERAAFDALVRAARAGEFDVVVVWNTDRLTRKSGRRSLLALVWELQEYGVRVLSCTQAEVVDDDLAEILFMVEGQRARRESQAKSQRSLMGARRRAEQGLHLGKIPFGFRRGSDGQALEAHPERAALVRRIFDEWNSGTTQSEIARRLTSDGIPTPRGGARWEQGTIRALLINPAYVGKLRFGGELLPAQQPALVTEGAWNFAQSRMQPGGRRREGGRESKTHLLSRLLTCGECGAVMNARRGESRADGSRYETYVCPNSNGKRGSSCSLRPVPRPLIDAAVAEHFAKHALDHERSKQAFDEYRHAQVAEREEALRRAERVLYRGRASLEAIRKDYREGIITGSEWRELKDELTTDIAAAEEAVAQSQALLEDARSAAMPDLEAAFAERFEIFQLPTVTKDPAVLAAARGKLGEIFRFAVFEGIVAEIPIPVATPAESAAWGALPDDIEDIDDLDGLPVLPNHTDNPEERIPLRTGGGDGWTVIPEVLPGAIDGFGIDRQPKIRPVPLLPPRSGPEGIDGHRNDDSDPPNAPPGGDGGAGLNQNEGLAT